MGRITIDNVRKEYDSDAGTIRAVDDVSLNVQDGEFLTIVGPSGSGKSTLLRMIAGLEDITGGEIRIDDTVVNNIAPQNRGVAMVFQNYALYPHMSVRQNMSYGLKLTTDLGDDEIRRRVEDTAEMMGIGDLLDKKPNNLSGGQQQRVATGRAIVRQPDVFLFDEPLSNLDAKLRLHMRTELQRIQEELETTSVYVTHDQTEAMTMSDRIVILNDGTIQQVGTPAEVYADPVNKFVADFIGSPSMNFFDVSLDDGVLYGDDFEYAIPSDLANVVRQNARSDDLVLGIRPEHVTVDTDGADTVAATLDVLEHEGSDNYLYLSEGDTEWTVRVDGNTRFEWGETVEFSLPPEHLHVFDAETGENLVVDEGVTADVDGSSVTA
ncbi:MULTISPECIES: ABC transporter ATP-binding protein [Haloarcula]|uniref:ABC-type D-xylose/L-arabinose transporter n=1 Tax=Haloarcula pellucida TaxID=1427151 RepID=A0A830GQ88_9EURY|nr:MULTISPECIES: sn-glycerol-3-phosphate ABC transporter ATP-binding protein UgpC [Halomicroarcula]MBX0349103.1 sn-glycerol-3-phosphate ABC transporter ATP-binding protein UgpC [Halomicroarcula pellucida]MDS0279304.1 sn-glycerol-3-phosphate ABC transporter ATP-binding protein UgpC [Halomicroarcula sp. S1AR25-4]GGN99038.1 sugar ABC transporter ATP-binding protein [Halomicroarcula pellucida]